MGRVVRFLACLAGLSIGACNHDGGNVESGTWGGNMSTLPASGTDTGGDEEPTGGADGSSGGSTKFDVGAPSGDYGREACERVDLLFVIDNSGSMKGEQTNLIASFPGFVEEIQTELAEVESLHIGVVTTDPYKHHPQPCQKVLGALVTQTGGANSSELKCGPYAEGGRYMTEADDLGPRFACAAQVGTGGSSVERPIAAALQALGPELADAGGCNEGFVRDDALLVLVLITDEEEEGSGGAPPDWYEELVALRGGVETNVVVLSLIGPEQPVCLVAAEVAYRIVEFTGMFTYGSVGQICADTYQPFFHDAIAVIDQACDHFTPPG